MKRNLALLSILFCLLCGACQKKTISTNTFLNDGSVFMELPLATPNSYRTGAGTPGTAYWQQQADHDIQVRLDVETNTIIGSEKITYHNNSPDSLSYIWLQLEQNAHRKDSIRSREGRSSNELSYKGIEIQSLLADGVSVIWHDYATVAKVLLEKPLNPNETVTLSIDWSFVIPDKVALRMGFDDRYDAGPIWELAQWFPTPCVYDDVYGWNTLPYIGRGEFYTNFGNYSVAITVPDNHVVFASGELTNASQVLSEDENSCLQMAMKSDEVILIRGQDELAKESSGEQTWNFEGHQIRTFAWATSASFIWEAASIEIKTLAGEPTRILCQVGYPEEVHTFWDEAVAYIQHSIKYYSESLYPYPWPQMSMSYGKAGGMEYPMLVFCRGRTHQSLFNVTDHEVGHNWFPMIVNTDERRHAWMDEGFNTFINHYSLEAFYGVREHKPDVSKYNASAFISDLKPINTPPDLLQSRGHLSYRKPGYGLRFLREEILGEERFDEAWLEYFHTWAFKSPRPADFYRAIEDASGVDLQWFFRGFFEETLQLDQAVINVTQQQKKDVWKVRVTIENQHSWVCPVALRIHCADGSIHDYKLPVTIWAWSSKHKQSFEVPSPVSYVEIDPMKAYPDVNRSNNAFNIVLSRAAQ